MLDALPLTGCHTKRQRDEKKKGMAVSSNRLAVQLRGACDPVLYINGWRRLICGARAMRGKHPLLTRGSSGALEHHDGPLMVLRRPLKAAVVAVVAAAGPVPSRNRGSRSWSRCAFGGWGGSALFTLLDQ